jgi:hypothetical protein
VSRVAGVSDIKMCVQSPEWRVRLGPAFDRPDEWTQQHLNHPLLKGYVVLTDELVGLLISCGVHVQRGEQMLGDVIMIPAG